jgi:glutamine synthetase
VAAGTEAGPWDELAASLRGRGVRIIHALHPDLFGRARSKQFPLSELQCLARGVAYSKTSLAESLDGEMLPGAGFPAGQGHPDLHAVPDPATARVVPWEPDAAWLLSDLVEHGRPSALCSRTAVRDVCAAFDEHDLAPVVAAEPEFYLTSVGEGTVEPYCDGRNALSYSTGCGVDPSGVVGRLHRCAIELDLDVGAATSEYSRGQFEINLRHGPALAAADRAFLLKEATKAVARREGLLATFMAKPFAGEEGSSLHLHVSVWRAGENVFARPDGTLSETCLSFVAGVLEHAPALTAFASPTVNSYKRLQPGGLVATVASWGSDNRLDYLRIPQERGEATRVELRAGDASASPYLLTAATLLAGLDGIERGLRPRGEPKALPRTLEAAIDELERDEVLSGRLRPELLQTYAALKRMEAARFAETVTEWEWQRYAQHA